jgi:prepilin-type N-terminal cleavage/methylation domain-containing protein
LHGIGPRLRLRQRRARGSNAFTLVEILVVMVLIAILAAMIIPEMKGTYEDAMLRSTSRDLVNAFSVAYSRAVSLNQLHRVRFDSRTGHYMVETRARGTGDRNPRFVPVADVAGAQGELDRRISVQVRQGGSGLHGAVAHEDTAPDASGEPTPSTNIARDTISFYPDGTADAAEVVLRDRAGFRLVLRINPITARVRTFEPARESEPGA